MRFFGIIETFNVFKSSHFNFRNVNKRPTKKLFLFCILKKGFHYKIVPRIAFLEKDWIILLSSQNLQKLIEVY